MIRSGLIAFLLALAASATCGGADPPRSKPGARLPESVEMISAILSGSQMGPSDGWFHPGASRYGWSWLAERYDKNHDGAIAFDEFTGPEARFDRLDRDRDGVIKADDLDWSSSSPFLQKTIPSAIQFRRFDLDTNGRISRDEWLAFFDRAAREAGDLVPEDYREALNPSPPRRPAQAPRPSGPPPDAPTPTILLKGLFQGEIGSLREGPSVGDAAPDFTLNTRDKKGRITLSGYRGRPVVLIFGSFT